MERLICLLALVLALTSCQLSNTTSREGGQYTLKVGDDTLTYEVIDGLAVYGGDIILGDADDIKQQAEEGVAPQAFSYGDGSTGHGALWPNGVVPYTIDANFSAAQQKDIKGAIAHWERYTPYKFVERTNEEGYLSFTPRNNICGAHLGYALRARRIFLSDGCDSRAVVHEIGHIIGLRHEHQRCDRDEHINVFWDNILDKKKHLFEKLCAENVEVGAYDPSSVMHYASSAFSKNDKPTLESKRGVSLGWRESLGPGDREGARARYDAEVASRTVTLYAAGQTNQETMQLKVDGKVVKTWNNVGGNAQQRKFVEYSYAVSDAAPQIGSVAVAFVNDNRSRDLRVDRLEVSGKTYQAEAATTRSTGSWSSANGCGAGYKKTEWLHCNGQFEFYQ